MSVSLTETKGWLKKLVYEVKTDQPNLFPLRYYVYRRDIGTLTVFNKPNG